MRAACIPVEPHVRSMEKERRPDPAQMAGTPSTMPVTAHPASFPGATEAAAGKRPLLPERMSDLYELSERAARVRNDLGGIETLIKERIRN